ncbi:hypothetical protein BD311DRAFT_665104 [Dichomitus squalens]|uniref:Uncharacterized protein n=1 Tax=Dichomitus squalens TaxID=114155 RepID=A0A4Q9ML69_9APHY|nr:hypothetical protein BD311DRAFT_665104 [Dichomitus squalens]
MNNDALAHQSDYSTANYPPENDTTSEGGYGSSGTFSPASQRRADPSRPSNDTGLITQSLDGGPLASELQDAKQGTDPRTRAAFDHDAKRDFDPLNPYGRNPDSKEETADRLASAYADPRRRQFESGAARGNDGDVGTL